MPEADDFEMTPEREELVARYNRAMHAMQTGVAFELSQGAGPASPKHLRVGVNSAMIYDAALVRLLIAKGVFTIVEYERELVAEAEREVARYEARAPEGVRFS